MMPLYEARDLKKYYGQTLALSVPEFCLEQGEALILEGANGSGKSTFLRILAWLEEPTSGWLRYFGSGEPGRECTLLLQEPWLMHAPVFSNVVLGLRLRGMHAKLQEKYNKAMSEAGFDDPAQFARRKPNALSGGEKQRVALAGRLILEPKVLLLDEPTAHVDAKSAEHILAALQAAQDKGTTIICASHDPDFGSRLGARTMRMKRPE